MVVTWETERRSGRNRALYGVETSSLQSLLWWQAPTRIPVKTQQSWDIHTYIYIYIYMCVCSNISDCWVCLKLFFTTKIVIWIRKTRISHWVLGTRFFRYTHVQPPSEWHQSEDDLSDLILFCTDVLGSYSCGWLHDPAPPTGWLKPYT